MSRTTTQRQAKADRNAAARDAYNRALDHANQTNMDSKRPAWYGRNARLKNMSRKRRREAMSDINNA